MAGILRSNSLEVLDFYVASASVECATEEGQTDSVCSSTVTRDSWASRDEGLVDLVREWMDPSSTLSFNVESSHEVPLAHRATPKRKADSDDECNRRSFPRQESTSSARALAPYEPEVPPEWGDDVHMRPLPKVKSRRKRANPFPQILKRDIRRDIPVMFTNVLNSTDEGMLSRFCDKYCVPSCQSIDYARVPFLPSKFLMKTVHGAHEIVNRFVFDLFVFPDLACHLYDSHIQHQLGQPGSKIVMHTHLQGVKPMSKIVRLEDSNRAVHTLPRWIFKRMVAACGAPAAEIMSNFPVISAPYELNLFGTVVFYMDSDLRIYRMEFDHVLVTASNARCLSWEAAQQVPSTDVLALPW